MVTPQAIVAGHVQTSMNVIPKAITVLKRAPIQREVICAVVGVVSIQAMREGLVQMSMNASWTHMIALEMTPASIHLEASPAIVWKDLNSPGKILVPTSMNVYRTHIIAINCATIL